MITTSRCTLPKYVSTDNDPLFRFHRWLANLRILGVGEIKSVPFVPQSPPFVERLIGTLRPSTSSSCSPGMGQILSASSLRTATTITSTVAIPGYAAKTPNGYGTAKAIPSATIESYEWLSHCHEMFHLPVAG